MLKGYQIQISGYGGVFHLKGERGTLKNIFLKSQTPLLVTLIADNYKEVLTDYTSTSDLAKIPVLYRTKTKNISVVVKAHEPVESVLNLTLEYD